MLHSLGWLQLHNHSISSREFNSIPGACAITRSQHSVPSVKARGKCSGHLPTCTSRYVLYILHYVYEPQTTQVHRTRSDGYEIRKQLRVPDVSTYTEEWLARRGNAQTPDANQALILCVSLQLSAMHRGSPYGRIQDREGTPVSGRAALRVPWSYRVAASREPGKALQIDVALQWCVLPQ